MSAAGVQPKQVTVAAAAAAGVSGSRRLPQCPVQAVGSLGNFSRVCVGMPDVAWTHCNMLPPPVHSQPSIPSQCRPYPSIPSQPPTPTHQPHTQLCRLPPPPTPHTSQPEHTPTTTTTMTSRQTPQQTSHHNKLHNKQEENSDTKLTVNSYCLSSTASIRSTKAVT